MIIIMKKLIRYISFLIGVTMLFTGCSEPQPSETESTPTSEIPSSEAETTTSTEQNPVEAEATPTPEPPLATEPAHKTITAQEAQSMMADDVIILDVRTREEYDDGHIRNAILLPYDEVMDKAESVIPDKGRTILVYCRSGRRSEAASIDLINVGYTSVYDFGGIIDWPGEIIT